MAGRTGQRHGRARAARAAHGARRVDGAGRAGQRGVPGAGRQRRAAVERIQADARGEVGGRHVMAETPHRPDGRQHVEFGVGRIQRDPLPPRALQEIQVARAVHATQQRHVGGRWRAQFADAALAQGLQHEFQPRGRFVAGHQFAAKHFLAAGVQVMDGVVEDQHGNALSLRGCVTIAAERHRRRRRPARAAANTGRAARHRPDARRPRA